MHTRRRFHERVILLLSSLMAAALALPAAAYLLLPTRSKKQSGWAEAGNVADLPKDKPTELVFQRKRTEGWKTAYERSTAWVVRTDDEVVAFMPSCTHLGCGYHWDKAKEGFVCPCHESLFAMDGSVVAGPAPRPLDRYQVRVEGKLLWLGDG